MALKDCIHPLWIMVMHTTGINFFGVSMLKFMVTGGIEMYFLGVWMVALVNQYHSNFDCNKWDFRTDRVVFGIAYSMSSACECLAPWVRHVCVSCSSKTNLNREDKLPLHTHTTKPLRKIKVARCNHKADNPRYLWPGVWAGDLHIEGVWCRDTECPY